MNTVQGDDTMENAVAGYKALDIQALKGKKRKIVSSADALKDVTPIEWSDEVLLGKKKATIKKAKD